MVANAGATNTGVVDPLAALADLCRQERLWLHVDAAYGWTAVLTAEGRQLLDGIGRADSLTLDPHKWFGQTFEAGCVLVREGGLLGRTFAMRPEYMQDVEPAEDEINFADHGIALTRRFRALKIWLSVQVLGLSWFRELAERCCLLAELGQRLLEEAGVFEILSPRQLSIVCFRYVPPGVAAEDEPLNALNLALTEALRPTGRAFLSSTRLNGQVALRFCFVNWRTHDGRRRGNCLSALWTGRAVGERSRPCQVVRRSVTRAGGTVQPRVTARAEPSPPVRSGWEGPTIDCIAPAHTHTP